MSSDGIQFQRNYYCDPRQLQPCEGLKEPVAPPVVSSDSLQQEPSNAFVEVNIPQQLSYFQMIKQYFQPKKENAPQQTQDLSAPETKEEVVKAIPKEVIQAQLQEAKEFSEDIELLLNTMKSSLDHPVTLEDIIKLNKLLYLMQQDFQTLDKNQIAFVQDERRKYNDEQLKLMKESLARLQNTNIWQHCQVLTAALSMSIAGVTMGGPLGITIVAFALGTALDNVLGDPLKDTIAWKLAGNDKESHDKIIGKINLGLSLIGLMLTIGTYGTAAVQEAAVPGMNSFWDFINAVKNGGYFVDANGVRVAAIDFKVFAGYVQSAMSSFSHGAGAISLGVETYHETKSNAVESQLLGVRSQITNEDHRMRDLMNSITQFISGAFNAMDNAQDVMDKETQIVLFILTGRMHGSSRR